MKGPTGHELAVAGLQLGRLGGVDEIAFVQGDLDGHLGALEQLDDEAIPAAGGLAAIHEQKHLIDFTDGATGGLYEPLPQQVMGLVDPGGVHEHQLGRGRGEDRPQPIAGGLGHRGGDRHLLADQLIHQGGLAHVGPSHQGDKA